MVGEFKKYKKIIFLSGFQLKLAVIINIKLQAWKNHKKIVIRFTYGIRILQLEIQLSLGDLNLKKTIATANEQ